LTSVLGCARVRAKFMLGKLSLRTPLQIVKLPTPVPLGVYTLLGGTFFVGFMLRWIEVRLRWPPVPANRFFVDMKFWRAHETLR